jgi:predicted PurR-regulated permease PerM
VDWFRENRPQRTDHLITLAIVLCMLLIVLAAWAILTGVLGILGRFHQQILMFIFGALIAYLLIPLVNFLQMGLRKRWAAIAGSYLLLFLLLILFGVLLLQPFISQARSLANNLQSPAATSLHRLQTVRTTTVSIERGLLRQQQAVSNGKSISRSSQQAIKGQIESLQHTLTGILAAPPPRGQIRIPPSYVNPIRAQVARMAAAYGTAVGKQGTVTPALDRAVTDARAAVAAANTSYKEAAGSPILLLNAQNWLDKHGIGVNLKKEFGSALQQLSNQISSILNSSLGIALQAGNLLLNTVLILIISVYFISDGARLVRWSVGLVPSGARPRVRYLVQSLDQILGSYLRTQVLLAAIAATLDATGAVVFGIPYAIVIFFSSFLLSLIPVIGPVILPFPPMIIALIFAPWPKPLLYLPWLLIGEQIATNVIGPRVQGRTVGIHPLEAMAAALVGFPIAGFVGAFFAVPIVSFLHVLVHEGIRSAREFDSSLESPAPADRPAGSSPARKAPSG